MVLLPAVQAVGLALILILAGGLGYLAVRCIAAERMAEASRATEMRVERANLDLQDAIGALQDKLGAVTRDRAQMLLQRMGTTQQQLAAEPRTSAHEPAGQGVSTPERRCIGGPE